MIRWSPLYVFAKVIVFLGWIAFYKRWKIENKPQYSGKVPTIYAPNHQSGFMDPVVVAAVLRSQTHFMVRADVFKSKSIIRVFRWLKMMPVYRQRDGKGSLEKNDAVFDNCFNILSHNQGIIMFPEGNQQNKKTLRPLKKGVGRVAFGAEEKFDFKLGVQVVPVGINYGHHTKMNSTVHVNYGEPILIKDYLDEYRLNAPKTLNDFRKNLQERLSKLVINISNNDFYETIEELRHIGPELIHEKAGLEYGPLENSTAAGQQFVKKCELWIDKHPEKASELQSETESLKTKVHELGLRYHLFSKKKHSVLAGVLALIVGFPIYLAGLFFNIIPYQLIGKFVKRKVKDPHFHSSIKMIGGTIVIYIFYIIYASIVSILWGWTFGLIVFFSAPLLGLFANRYRLLFLKTRGRIRYNSLTKTNNSYLKSAKILRSNILNKVDQMY